MTTSTSNSNGNSTPALLTSGSASMKNTCTVLTNRRVAIGCSETMYVFMHNISIYCMCIDIRIMCSYIYIVVLHTVFVCLQQVVAVGSLLQTHGTCIYCMQDCKITPHVSGGFCLRSSFSCPSLPRCSPSHLIHTSRRLQISPFLLKVAQ